MFGLEQATVELIGKGLGLAAAVTILLMHNRWLAKQNSRQTAAIAAANKTAIDYANKATAECASQRIMERQDYDRRMNRLDDRIRTLEKEYRDEIRSMGERQITLSDRMITASDKLSSAVDNLATKAEEESSNLRELMSKFRETPSGGWQIPHEDGDVEIAPGKTG
jgi:seryl-tRNA synthetase